MKIGKRHVQYLYSYSMVLFLFLSFSLSAFASHWDQSARRNHTKTINKNKPVDARGFISPHQFRDWGEGEWISQVKRAKFPYDELIYSWSARLPEGEGFRAYLRAGFSQGKATPWIYAGYWGNVNLIENRKLPEFDEGRIEYDQLLLNRKANTYQFKIVSEGEKPLSILPSFHIIYTDNSPSSKTRETLNVQANPEPHPEIVFDLPLNAQKDSNGNRMVGRCQSAALSTALEFFGRKYDLEKIVEWTDDPEYQKNGIWPKTVGAGVQLGFDAYIDRFRDWQHVRETLMKNRVILCSITMPKDGDYIAPPYSSMTGHIVALNGITDDGRVVVTDSALIRDQRGYLCQWLKEDFEKIWMINKGGVGMVICPPPGFSPRLVENLPEFPKDRKK